MVGGVPVSGTSVGRMTLRICSMEERSGDNPPCMVNIFSSMIAAIGRQLKQSVNVFHNLILYLRLPREKGISMIISSESGGRRERRYIRRKNHRSG